MSVSDSIERELILPVPPARVWKALTQPDQLSAWFGTQATVDLRPGGEVTFTWDGSTGPTGATRGVIETVDPPRCFAFRWRPSSASEQTTRVEFTLEPHAEGTRLRLVESGFSSLPPAIRDTSHRDNTQGWHDELDELANYLVSA